MFRLVGEYAMPAAQSHLRELRLKFSDNFVGFRVFHEGESEPLFTKIFDWRSYQVNLIINDKKPVVRLSEFIDINLRILLIMSDEVQTKLFGKALSLPLEFEMPFWHFK